MKKSSSFSTADDERNSTGEIIMYRVTIAYNHPSDPAAFDEYFVNNHLPIVRAIPNLAKVTFGKCETLDGSAPEHYGIAVMYFESKEAAIGALTSQEGKAASADVANYSADDALISFSNEDHVWP